MPKGVCAVPGIKVGLWTDPEAATGCTVVLCEAGAVAGVDVRGSAPGTRETDLLRPGSLVQRVHGILLSGGSAFGLDAAAGVMRYLEERRVGFKMGRLRVPIVPAAILFDLGVGKATVRPGPEEGYLACQGATARGVPEGSVGAGTGATVAKALGLRRAIKGGQGAASAETASGIVVGALAVVNALGDVVEPESGKTVAAPRRQDGRGFEDTIAILQQGRRRRRAGGGNTTLAVVATNARLTREQVNKVAQMAQDGLAVALRPAHTMFDGDVVFALATGTARARLEVSAVGALAARLVARAIVRGVRQATTLGGVPAVRDLAVT